MAQAPQDSPLTRVLAEALAARKEVRFEEAVAKREQARGMLDEMPAGSPNYAADVQSVAQAYSESGMTARARAILQHALDRTAALGKSHLNRIALLGMMADSWRQDRNLLKAVGYLEQAAAAQESAKPRRQDGLIGAYARLAELYRELGRVEALGTVFTKFRALPNNGVHSPCSWMQNSQVLIEMDNPLAHFFEQQDLIEEAVAVYQEDIERAATANDRVEALQALAGLHQRQGRHGEAAEALQRAVDVAGTEDRATLQQGLAAALQQAGRTAEADRLYRQLSDADHGPEALMSYAAHLSETGRAAQAEELLRQYQASHTALEKDQAASLLYALSGAAAAAGAKERSEQYLDAANEIQGMLRSADFPESSAAESDLQKANSAAVAGNEDQAFALALRGIEGASIDADIGSTVEIAATIASALASKEEIVKAEQLYKRLFALAERRSRDVLTPLLDVAREHARFLISQPSRWSAVSVAIAGYRDLLTEAHGAEIGTLEEVAGMNIDFETARESPRAAMAAAQELLWLQESFNGNTSEPYLEAIPRAARVYEENGDAARAAALHRKAVSIADLVYTAGDERREKVRMEAAFALARQEQFDDAERFAGEAVAISRSVRRPFEEPFGQRLEEIRDMRRARQ